LAAPKADIQLKFGERFATDPKRTYGYDVANTANRKVKDIEQGND